MKINQLFVKKVDPDVALKLLNCFGLQNLDDRKSFTKHDLIANQVVDNVRNILPELLQYYLPCKARVYLDNLSERRVLTILRQVVRLYDHYVHSKEKNINSHKVIVYQLSSGVNTTLKMTKQPRTVDFT
jgi:hypothetical protein